MNPRITRFPTIARFDHPVAKRMPWYRRLLRWMFWKPNTWNHIKFESIRRGRR